VFNYLKIIQFQINKGIIVFEKTAYILFSFKSLYYKELFCTFAGEIGYGGGDNSPLVC